MKSNTLKGKIGIVSRSHLGMVRQNQEDNHYYSINIRDENSWQFYSESVIDDNAESLLLLVADGMGGLEMGEMASEIARETARKFCTENSALLIESNNLQDVFNKLFARINDEILNFAAQQGKAGELGTTLVIAFVKNKTAHVFWIGDSRCYVVRKGKLRPVSKDHSYVQELVDQGKITYEQAFFHPESNIITKYMGDPKTTPVPSYTTLQIDTGDILLLCSDGLNGMLQDHEIEMHFYNNDNLISITEKLIESANKAGGHDNDTVIMASFGDFARYIPAIIPPADPPSQPDTGNQGGASQPPKIVTIHKLDRKKALIIFVLGIIIGAALLFAIQNIVSGIRNNTNEQSDTSASEILPDQNEVVPTTTTSDEIDSDLNDLEEATETEVAVIENPPTTKDTHPLKLKDYPEVVALLDEIEKRYPNDEKIQEKVNGIKKNNGDGSFKGPNSFATLLDHLKNVIPMDSVGKPLRDRLQGEIDKIKK